mgnify:CR=1 FL=1
MSLLLSCAYKKSIASAVILCDGRVLSYKTVKIRDEEISSSSYRSIIYTFDLGLKLLKVYLDEFKDTDSIIFEVNNSNFMKWVSQGYSKDAYRDEFAKMLESLNDLPIRYSIRFTDKPRAFSFVDVKYIKREKLTSLD